MVSWARFVEIGARSFARDISVPDGEAGDVVEKALREEIYRRAPEMANPPKLNVARWGQCSACAGWMPRGEGGWCPLCNAARAVYLREKAAA